MSIADRRTDALIGGAIFDVDGTLLDTMPYWHDVGARFLTSIGVEPEEGLGDRLFTETPISGAAYLQEHYHLDLSLEEIVKGTNAQIEQVYEEVAPFKPGARELVERFVQAGIPCTVASSTDRYCIEAGLRRLGALDLFDAVFSAGELNTTKESPLIFYAAMDAMGTEESGTWVFEDGLYAIRTARAAGFRTVGVYDRMSEADQEEIMRQADFYYRSLEDFEFI